MLHRTFLLTLGLFALASTIKAQKMNILDFHKAFVDNALSPDNQLLSKYSPEWVEEGGTFFLHENLGGQINKTELLVDANKTYLKYKKAEGWNFSKCYPTFKLYTRADGKQILAVTEDGYRHHGYRSKYRPTTAFTKAQKAELSAIEDECIMEELSVEETNARTSAFVKKHSAISKWNNRPKPIKFWSYEGGAWKDITDEVIAEEVWLTLKEMIISTTDLVKAEDVDYMLEKYILHHDGMYPLYRLDPNTNDITVWVDHNHLKKITDKGLAEVGSEDGGTQEDGSLVYDQVILGSYGEEVGRLVDFIDKTKFRTYTLSFDAKTGKFVRKK